MEFNFDQRINRKGTCASKYELIESYFGCKDITPMWIADMELPTPEFILKALAKRLDHPVLGYSVAPSSYYEAIQGWLYRRHHWSVAREWISYVPGVVAGIAFAINVFTKKEDEVIILPPVYPPFIHVPEQNERILKYAPLAERNGQFEIDFDLFESLITPKTKLFILCNPHNPGGRVWTKEELLRIAEICERHHVLVVSDEIHADLVLPGHKHMPFATVSNEAANNSITLMAPSKTFNIPGMVSSYAIIPNPDIRKAFQHFVTCNELANGNLFAYLAAEVAYNEGAEWLQALLAYLQSNIDYVIDYFSKEMPELKIMRPQASFLLWIDFTALGYSECELKRRLLEHAKVGMNFGTTFGLGGDFHQRLNVGCPRSLLEEVLPRIVKALR